MKDLARESRITRYFERVMPELKGQPVLVKQRISKRGFPGGKDILRDGNVVRFENGHVIVCLAEDSYELEYRGQKVTVNKKEETLFMKPTAFLEAYDEYVDWVIMESPFDRRTKNRILRKHSKFNTEYYRAYAGTKTVVTSRTFRAWEIPHTLNLNTGWIRNSYY